MKRYGVQNAFVPMGYICGGMDQQTMLDRLTMRTVGIHSNRLCEPEWHRGPRSRCLALLRISRRAGEAVPDVLHVPTLR